ncbi:MAG: JmjC domain-containing protein, partial [Gammaproteobacteria bacterium]
LEPGDMLYLPPQIAHDGVAVDACFTYSIGFRAPAYDELKSRFLAYLDDAIQIDGIYRDPDLEPVSHPGLIDHAMVARVARTLSKISWNRQTIVDFLGRYLTEPKLQVVFERPPAIGFVRFAATARRTGVKLSLASQLLLHRHRGFINGESFALSGLHRDAIMSLADRRRLEPEKLSIAHHTLQILYGWYLAGYIRFMARGPT